jgi:hypothetical protein
MCCPRPRPRPRGGWRGRGHRQCRWLRGGWVGKGWGLGVGGGLEEVVGVELGGGRGVVGLQIPVHGWNLQNYR